ncbi:MAG: hypothetical protein UV59_C0009G0022 [Candidatus Gottesmanbacteria bacterium GW2011_GWA1_43_11]|uniref:Uncharacterized protein n=1 Tax=Candidatus Gottesmanbacteria bacterium GW2011_GWA1_43_11 TaxID=1618436 RepID=A0A0G1CHF9_9BACT|nr:MAG: hypothetical protein UV59_C0009G0022 [Candidatus Gottesmanbacteria bacterium GW2011_GWA1_43_11]
MLSMGNHEHSSSDGRSTSSVLQQARLDMQRYITSMKRPKYGTLGELVWDEDYVGWLQAALITCIQQYFPGYRRDQFPDIYANQPSDYNENLLEIIPFYHLPRIPIPAYMHLIGGSSFFEMTQQEILEAPTQINYDLNPSLMWVEAIEVPTDVPKTRLLSAQEAISFILQYPNVPKKTAITGFTLNSDEKFISSSQQHSWILHRLRSHPRLDESTQALFVNEIATLRIVPHKN